MAELPYMQFYPADWLGDTRALSLSAKGAWIDLISAMWTSRERGRLCMRLSAYGRLIGTTEERTADIIEELHDLGVCERMEDGTGKVTLECRRIVRDAAKLEEQATERSESAKRAAEARWAKQKECEADALRMRDAPDPQCDPDAIPEARRQKPDTRSHKQSTPKAPKGATVYPPEFLDFWKAYPRKVGKDKALRAWKKRKPDLPPIGDLTAILARHVASAKWNEENGRYIPHPSTWLNEGRWNDDVSGSGTRPKPKEKEEPSGWREVAERLFPDRNWLEKKWKYVYADDKQAILAELGKEGA